MDSDTDKNHRRASREMINKETKFYVNADIITAQALDLSNTGIRIETTEPITVHMRVGDDESEIKTAKLVWAKKQADGSVSYGLEFSDDTEENPF